MKRKSIITLLLIIIIFSIGCISDNNINKSNNNQNTNNNQSNNNEIISYKDFLPENILGLSEDFYPGGLTRDYILKKYPEALKKTGNMEFDMWSGVIKLTGDAHIGNLTIAPGTIVFIEANIDDQNDGWISNIDPVNPHEFFGENYSFNHIFLQVSNELIARGTADEPIIITSTSNEPWLADWEKIVFNKGVLEYAIVEYGNGIAIESSDATISHCLIRNMLSQGVMFGTWPEAGIHGESIAPNITYNYMYNFGHMAVQSFFSEPYIAYNIFIHKYTDDPDLYDYLNLGENGGLDIHGGNGTVEYNFLSYGYDADMEKESQLGGSGIGITSATRPVIRYNMIIGNKWGIELQGGLPTININNIYNNLKGNLVVRTVYTETGRESEVMEYKEPLDFKNNYWGTDDKNIVIEKMNVDAGIELSIDPIRETLISKTGPDWSEFEWLYD